MARQMVQHRMLWTHPTYKPLLIEMNSVSRLTTHTHHLIPAVIADSSSADMVIITGSPLVIGVEDTEDSKRKDGRR